MKVVLGIFLFFLCLACKKVEDRTCWKGEGEVTTITRNLSSFSVLETQGSVEVHLVQDTLTYAKLTCGTKLAKQITTVVENNHLKIQNHNRCSFIRPKQVLPILEIHYMNIDTILHGGSETLKTLNTLIGKELILKSLDNSSHLELTVDLEKFVYHTSDSWTDLTIHGKTDQALFYQKGNAFCDASELNILGDATVITKSVGNITLGELFHRLTVDIRSSGNVYYSGAPTSIQLIDTGDGELIHL